jgi:pimeloyl-ACP methyl ester carboxylesterase
MNNRSEPAGPARRLARRAGVAFVALAGLAVGVPPPALAGTDELLTRFHAQQPAWHGCRADEQDEIGKQLDAIGARCAELTVPVDYRNPGGRTTTIAIARREATDRARRLGTLVINTGGPGESRSGVSWVAQGMPPFVAGAPRLAERFDLVAMDPRFMGRSAPLACGWPVGLGIRAAFVGPDRASFDRSVALNRDIAARCAGQQDLLPHISTRNMVRDLEVVRTVLRERRVSFLGWSYGGYLGAVYMQMFPQRLDRVLLDSALNPDSAKNINTYPSLGTGPAKAAEQRNWAAWAARHHDRYGLGSTTEQVLAAVDVIRRAADRGSPVRLGRHLVDPNAVRSLGLGDDAERAYEAWSGLMRMFYDAARGIPVTLSPEDDQFFASLSSTEVAPEASGGQAAKCADAGPVARDPEVYYRDIRAHRDAEPFFGPSSRNITPCGFWPAKAAEPRTRVGNSHPVLLVGATGDPTVPYPGQAALHQSLTGSRMVTLGGAFRHGVTYFEGNPCVDDVVNRYLLTGALPGADITCTRSSPYPGDPGPGRTTEGR